MKNFFIKIITAGLHLLKITKSMAKRFFIKPKLPKNKDGKVMVHIGCGEINDCRYVNVDARPLEHVHYVTKDVDNLNFLASNSIDLVYMCHTLEHFDRKKVRKVMAEVFRTLKKAESLGFPYLILM